MTPLTIHFMTPTLSPGDAIGNYLLTSAQLWRQWGATVYLYADAIAPVYGGIAQPSTFYRPTGQDLLWYHYSIYADNITIATHSPDFTVMDFHGITPPHLFAGQDDHLQFLCQKGLDLLPTLTDAFDLCVVHSEYTREQLQMNGYKQIHKLPLCLDTTRFNGQLDEALATNLAHLEYLLFIGRLVPQKDILALLDIFEQVQRQRPHMILILVGSRQVASNYQRQIDRAIKKKGLENRILFTGQVNHTAVLAALLQQAQFLLVTSEWETFCVPVVEAMYFGTPAIVHDVPPLPEVAGTGGLIIDKHQPQHTAVTILNYLEDQTRYRQLATAAQAQATHFTDKALESSLLQMLTDVFGVGT